MSQKLEFIEKASTPGANISELCREYGISRQTGHKWLRRYRQRGYVGLSEQSRRPLSSPLATGEEIVVRILELRDRHLTWGPDNGRPRVEVKAPNDLWTIDIKGWWRARNGEKCEPLTVRDAFSRKVLAVTLLARTGAQQVRRILLELFEQHGLPAAIQCDNGPPFVCVRARGGLTILSAWLISLGIRLVRSRPGCPQDNGGHERMHRDLSELELAPARTRRAQQRACDRWMVDFNEVRPHDALGSKTPAEVYRDSSRRSLAPLVPSYPAEWKTRRVSRNGNVSVNDDSVFVSMALASQIIGLHQEDVLRWHCYFFGVDLGAIEVIPSLGDVFSSGPVSSIVNRGLPTETTAPSTVNAPATQTEPQKDETVTA